MFNHKHCFKWVTLNKRINLFNPLGSGFWRNHKQLRH